MVAALLVAVSGAASYVTVAASSGSGNIAGATVVPQNVMSAGLDDTCAILPGGTVDCWGNGYLGQLGNGSAKPSSTPVPVTGLTGATQVTSTQLSNCALTGGLVQCWGDCANVPLAMAVSSDSYSRC